MASRHAKLTVVNLAASSDDPIIYKRITNMARKLNVTPSAIVKEALVARYGWRAEWGMLNVHQKRRPFKEDRISPIGRVNVPLCLYELLKKEAKVRRVRANKLLGAITSTYLRDLERQHETED